MEHYLKVLQHVLDNCTSKKTSKLSQVSVFGYAMKLSACTWENNHYGIIVDDGLNDVLRFISVDNERIQLIQQTGDHIPKELFSSFPLVAEGIVAFWLKNRKTIKRTRHLFEAYYRKCLNAYDELHQGDSDEWKRNLDKEFVLCEHKKLEESIQVQSQNLLKYFPKEDVDEMLDIYNNYMEYIEEQKKIRYPDEVPQIGNSVFRKLRYTIENIKKAAAHCIDKGLFWAETAWHVIFSLWKNNGYSGSCEDFASMVNQWGSTPTYKSVTKDSIYRPCHKNPLCGTPTDWKNSGVKKRIWTLGLEFEDNLAIA